MHTSRGCGNPSFVTADSERLNLELPARPESVSRVRRRLLKWLSHRAEVPATSTGAIALAVSEAVGNASRHAYREGEGTVGVDAVLDDGRLEVAVSDSGRGFAPHADRESNGLGMMIIARLADDLSLNSDGGGTEVRIGFDLGGSGPSRPARRPAGPGRMTDPAGRLRAATR